MANCDCGNQIESYWDNIPEGTYLVPPASQLFGRVEVLTGVDEITRDNLQMVLSECMAVHWFNAAQIDYLYRYNRGMQPVLNRKKATRPEINNKVVENHASEVSQFTAAYFMGEPVVYVRRGEDDGLSDDVRVLNDYMMFEDKATRDMEMATWMAICGVGYRMCLPDDEAFDDPDLAPFEIDTPDPRATFVAYSTGFGHKRMMGCRMVWRQRDDGAYKWLICGYTRTHYFEVWDGAEIVKWEPHTLRDIPIFEYRLNMNMLGSFEPAIPVLNAINTIQSNRVDGLEQFVQSFLKFVNCDIEEDTVEQLRKMGAIVLKSVNGLNSDVDIVSQELNQQQTQTLVDYLYDQVLYICGLPTTTKGGGSTSDTGAAVLLRDGWQQCEARAQQTEKLYRKSEREFLRLVLRIMGDTRPDIDLKLSGIECKFTRRQHDNLQSKCQALSSLLQAGIHPEIAIATSGLFNDPMDVYKQSEEYLEKWKPVPMNANPELGEGGGNPKDVPPEEEDTEVTEDEEKVAEGGEKGDGGRNLRCALCGKPLPEGRKKYCSDDCLNMARYLNNNGANVKAYRPTGKNGLPNNLPTSQRNGNA